MRGRVVKAFDQFHDVRLKSERGIAALIADLGVDIAIDLKGHTSDARPGIFALRPGAGAGELSGLSRHHGRRFHGLYHCRSDGDAAGAAGFLYRKDLHLPDCYQANDASRADPRRPSRAEAGLPEQAFCLLLLQQQLENHPAHVRYLDAAAAAVPGSVLWLLQDNADAAAAICGGRPRRAVWRRSG